MNALRPVLEGYIDLNIALVFSLAIWFVLRAFLARTPYAASYPMQLRLLTLLFVCILLSPVLAAGVSTVAHHIWPNRSLAVSDIVVASFLRGEIAMPAVAFEELLNTRQRWRDTLIEGESLASWVVLLLFLAGVSASLLRAFFAALSIRSTVRQSFLWRSTPAVDIRLSDRVTIPFAVRGFRRRHVVLPSDLVTQPRDVRFVLAHEFEHLRNGDTEWELFFELFRPLFFWNPAILVWKQQFDRLRELSCDQTVVSRRGMDVRDYTACLLSACSRTVGPAAPRVMNVAFVKPGRAKRVLLRRIHALRRAPNLVPRRSPLVLTTLAVTTASLIALGTASIRQTQDWSHDRLMLSTVVNLERLEAINRGF